MMQPYQLNQQIGRPITPMQGQTPPNQPQQANLPLQANPQQQNTIQRMAQGAGSFMGNLGQAGGVLANDLGSSINRNVVQPVENTLGNVGRGFTNTIGSIPGAINQLNPFMGLQNNVQRQRQQMEQISKLSK